MSLLAADGKQSSKPGCFSNRARSGANPPKGYHIYAFRINNGTANKAFALGEKVSRSDGRGARSKHVFVNALRVPPQRRYPDRPHGMARAGW